jgi:hypothetical protein
MIKKLLFISMFLFAANVFAQDAKQPAKIEVPPDFVDDGCTWFPDGNYVDCCVIHDKTYYVGGSWKQRWKADGKLFKCVAAKKGVYPKLLAPIIWAGVRIGGAPFLPTKFRWGFGKDLARKRTKKTDPPANNDSN